jgi:hypothetical protein
MEKHHKLQAIEIGLTIGLIAFLVYCHIEEKKWHNEIIELEKKNSGTIIK